VAWRGESIVNLT
jgi:hypothetical protein